MTLLAASRANLKGADAFIVQTDDAHGSEYTAPCDNRRGVLSGFSGSAGTAVFTQTKAALWTDGRYFLQAGTELDSNDWILMKDGISGTPTIEEWLMSELPSNGTIGVDGFTTRFSGFNKIKDKIESTDLSLVALENNPIDGAWGGERPARPEEPIVIMPQEYTGKDWNEKIKDVRQDIEKSGACGLVITMLDEIAWLFNIRGNDIPFNPLFFAYCYVGKDEVKLFMNLKQVTEKIRSHLDGVHICDYSETLPFLKNLQTKTLASSNSPYGIVSALKSKIVVSDTPVSVLKSIKNATEIEGMLRANVRSAVCHCKLLKWVEDNAGSGISECDAVDELNKYYRQQKEYQGQSFDTIASSGGSGSIIHYKPKRGSDNKIAADKMFLLDAGAHYSCGTTDTTRTIHTGTPTDFQRECYTRVLQGHINLITLVFPEGTRGPAMDILSRSPLWSAGLQFHHGTGHGIGCWLNVHEPPVGLYISPRGDCVAQSSNLTYKPGYCVTDEPGYYQDGEFGIRIENAIVVEEAKTKYNLPNNLPFYQFKSLCYVPMCRKLIDPSLLTAPQRTWLNKYHEETRNLLIPECKEQGWDDLISWITHETQPL